MSTYRLECDGGRILQLAYIAPDLYELRLIAGHRYLTPRLRLSFEQINGLEHRQDILLPEVRIGRHHFDYTVDFMGEHWATIGSYPFFELVQKVLAHDPSEI